MLNATIDAAAGEQLAAHRLEWQPHGDLRLGLTEAARYHASGWSPLYLVGVIPYTLVQRLQVQDEPDSTNALRNNVLFGVDAAWRVAPGTRLYGELAVDDLHAKTCENPDKIAWQIGWDGAGMIGPQRLTWGAELTRVWRYVYTSYYGRSATRRRARRSDFRPGPTAGAFAFTSTGIPRVAWQWSARAASTDQGEGTLERGLRARLTARGRVALPRRGRTHARGRTGRALVAGRRRGSRRPALATAGSTISRTSAARRTTAPTVAWNSA